MTRLLLVAILATVAAVSSASDQFHLSRGTTAIHRGAPIETAKALGDTLYLIGNPENPDQYDQHGIGPQAVGTFETAAGQPDWHGWTSEDLTEQDPYWQVSDLMPLAGQYSGWCGTEFGDDAGYGNDWDQTLLFRHAVDAPGEASTVVWSFSLAHDVEAGWDFVHVQWNQAGQWVDLAGSPFSGTGTLTVDESWTVQPDDYAGDAADEIQLRIRVLTDEVTSDEDGGLDTNGACRVDDITVSVDGTVIDFEDFEDQVSQEWIAQPRTAVGDFAALYTDLYDLDPCLQNTSAQVAFVDDGVVVPGTGGTPGITWNYGPGGYILNNDGGLAGDEFHLDNAIVSPPLTWPAGCDGAWLEFEVYVHEFTAPSQPGMFYAWFVRSVDTGDPADLADAPLDSDFSLNFGGPEYRTVRVDLARYLEPDRTHVQVVLRILQLGHQFGFDGNDGTPAPYFDNVRLAAYAVGGPQIESREIDHYQDAFPASGVIDLSDLGSNHVPLDIAANKADWPTIDPGDSLVFDAGAIRDGAFLNVPPRLHVRMRANPLFDPYRALPDGLSLTPDHFADGWSLVEGWVEADSCYFNSAPIQDRWCVDLPDQWFFYPGDELRWCIEAQDNLAGDIGTSLLPADTTGLTDFSDSVQYPSVSPYPHSFIVRALPTVHDADGEQPSVLFWNDAGDDALEWRTTFADLGRRQGVYYDRYETRGGADEDGNGLGGRAQAAQLAGYDVILYGSGALQTSLLGDGHGLDDASPDVPLLNDWFEIGDKHLLVASANAAERLQQTPTGATFLNHYLGVAWLSEDIAPLIGGQTSPLVRSIPGSGAIGPWEWVANGGCPSLAVFDAIGATASATRIAEFTDPSGQGGVYDYAAGVYNEVAAVDARTIYLPYGLEAVVDPPGHTGLSVRAELLYDVLTFFDEGWIVIPGSPAPAAVLSARAYPNPFNPATTIALTIPRAGEVSLKVYDLRGALVRTLVAGEMPAGTHQVVWDGTSDAGRAVASGIYFYETRARDAVSLGKLTLVK
jgi:hypothetical protein